MSAVQWEVVTVGQGGQTQRMGPSCIGGLAVRLGLLGNLSLGKFIQSVSYCGSGARYAPVTGADDSQSYPSSDSVWGVCAVYAKQVIALLVSQPLPPTFLGH